MAVKRLFYRSYQVILRQFQEIEPDQDIFFMSPQDLSQTFIIGGNTAMAVKMKYSQRCILKNQAIF